jgi:hypothetical protein
MTAVIDVSIVIACCDKMSSCPADRCYASDFTVEVTTFVVVVIVVVSITLLIIST